MLLTKIVFTSLIIVIAFSRIAGQNLKDSTFSISQVPQKYVSQISNKVEKYSKRMTFKTEKTLTKLSRWENKIHSLLQKTSPQAAEQLFGNNQTTFNSLLKKIKEGEAVAENYKAQYDGYVDKLSTNLKYLQQQETEVNAKLVQPLKEANQQMQNLQQDIGTTAYIQQFIKERKKQLFTEAVKYLGKSKYLSKINKESYYYIETLKNYKEIFSDTKKTEEAVKQILDKIPAFQKFAQQNSQLASIFGVPQNYGSTASLVGLQTRASVQQQIQQRISAGGPNAMAQVQQNLAAAHAEINKLKDKINQLGGGSSEVEMPDFKPNTQKTKTFLQRLEYGFNVQFSKNNTLLPSTSDMALSLGYKLNDKSIAGIGMSYKMGMGSIEHIRITNQGIGFRSFLDYKIKKQLFLSGGYEMNYNAGFKNIEQLKDYNAWQRSALLGISKKYKISKKIKGNMQLLYDFLARDHVPVSQRVLFRVGYKF